MQETEVQELIARFRSKVEKGFAILSEVQEESRFYFAVQPRYSHDESFEIVLQEFESEEFYPLYRRSGEELVIAFGQSRKRREFSPALHLSLLLLTAATITWAGYVNWTERNLTNSLLFSASLIAILGSHELGHALLAKRRGIKATLPFFIPAPPQFIFGTLGAVIFMNSPPKNRNDMLDLGCAGPFAGFAITLPVLIAGLALSSPTSVEAVQKEEVLLGPSLLLYALTKLFFSEFEAINLHPLAVAGWVGLFVTSLNLLPMGQLDGGHVIRAAAANRYRGIMLGVGIVLLLFSVFWPGWAFWVLLIYAISHFEHAGPLNDVSELSEKRKYVAALAMLLLLLSFTPVPLLYGALLE